LSVLIDLYKHKHLIPIFDHDIKLGLNKILIYAYQIALVFGQKSTFYIGLHLCVSFNINMNDFKNLPTFKKYIKNLNLDCI